MASRALPDLVARIRLDSAGVQEGVDGIGSAFSKSNVVVGTAVAAIGVVVGVLKEASEKYITLAESVHGYMRVTGESADVAGREVQAFQELGVNGEAAESSMVKFSKAIELTPKKLQALGVEIAYNAKGNVDLHESLFKVIDAYNGTEDAAKRNTIMITAFGKGGMAMIPILEAGSASLRKLEADARVTFTESDIEQVHKLELANKQVKASWDSMWENLGQKLIPAQKQLSEAYLENEYINKRLNETQEKGIEIGGRGSLRSDRRVRDFAAEWVAANAAKEKLAEYSDQTNRAAQASDALAKSINAADQELETSHDAALKLERANLALSESVDKVDKAQDAVNVAIHKYGPASEEAKAAADALTGTMLDQKDKYEAAAKAAGNLAKDQLGPNATAMDKATAYHDAHLQKLREEAVALAPGSVLRQYLNDYIEQLAAIPLDKTTTITANYVTHDDSQSGRGARARGGPVIPGNVYTVGEEGPETLVMGGGGGMVIPNSGGGGSKSGGISDALLASIDAHLADLAGRQPLSAGAGARRQG